MKKRIFAFIMALALCASVLVVPALAVTPTCNLIRQSSLITASMGLYDYSLKISGYGEAYPSSGTNCYKIPFSANGTSSISVTQTPPGSTYYFGSATASYYYMENNQYVFYKKLP